MTQSVDFKQKCPPFPRLGGRLHIFPALIPMIEILPWLLGVVGALAGVTQVAFWRKHRTKVFVFALLCFVAAVGIVAWKNLHRPSEEEGSRLLAEGDWPKLTVFETPREPAAREDAEGFAELWTVKTKNESLATPVIAGNLMLIGTFGATLDARSLSDGTLLWSLKKHEPIFTNPVATGDHAFVGEGLHTAVSAGLTAFSLPRGEVIWERQFRSHVESSVLLDEGDNRLWTPAGEESVWCLDTRDGSVIWRRRLGHTDATPLLQGGKLFASAWPDEKVNEVKLYALDPDDGSELWNVTLAGHPMGSPQAGPDGVILVTTAIGQVGPKVATDKGWAHAVSADGKLLWTVELPGISLPEAAVLPEKRIVIHTLKTGEIIALNIRDGSRAWSVTLDREILAPAALDASASPPLLAALGASGVVAILNAENGTDIRRFNVRQGGYAAPVFHGDLLYVTTSRSITAYAGVHSLTRGLHH
jgi:outer membrane protein assembly factor BamB